MFLETVTIPYVPEWPSHMYEWTGELLGKGGYGCVWKGRDKKTKKFRAVKVRKECFYMSFLLITLNKQSELTQ